MKEVLKQPGKATYGSGSVSVTYNRGSEIEKKIASMKVFNQTSDEYEESQKKSKAMVVEAMKGTEALEGINCSYRGAFVEGDYDKRYKFVSSVIKDLDFLDICFNCETKMVDKKAIDNAWDMHDYNSGGPYLVMDCEDQECEKNKEWKAKNDAFMEKEEKRVQKLKSEGNFVVLHERAHEIFKTTLESHCPKCGNVGSITMNLEPTIITDYGIKESRAGVKFGEGALVYNEKEKMAWPQLDLFQKLKDGEKLVTHGNENYDEVKDRLHQIQREIHENALKAAIEKHWSNKNA